MPDKSLTPLELEIMQVLWEHGPGTVAEVQPQLKKPLAYTTVMTMLTVLLRKGKVRRTQQGRAFRYRAAVSRERATGSAVRDLLDRVFAGSADALVMSLVETRGLTAADLNRLSRLVARSEAAREETALPPSEASTQAAPKPARRSREAVK